MNVFDSGENVEKSGPNTQFLPNFLMGDSSQTNFNSSPVTFSSQSPNIQPQTFTPLRQSFKTDKASLNKQSINTPPSQSLWSTINRTNSSMSSKPPIASQNRIFDSPMSNNNNSMQYNNQKTPDRLYSALVHENRETDNYDAECWVTIFGFPLARASFVLHQFSQFGTIERHVTTNNGNWIHIKYRNRIQAQNALSKNGRIIGDHIMIGVRQCEEKTIMKLNQGMAYESITSESTVNSEFLNRGNSSIYPLSDRTNTPGRLASVSRNSSMRVLGSRSKLMSQQSDRHNASFENANASSNNKPSMISKAFSYVFGWS